MGLDVHSNIKVARLPVLDRLALARDSNPSPVSNARRNSNPGTRVQGHGRSRDRVVEAQRDLGLHVGPLGGAGPAKADSGEEVLEDRSAAAVPAEDVADVTHV